MEQKESRPGLCRGGAIGRTVIHEAEESRAAHVLLRRRDKLLSMIEKSGAGHFEAARPQFFGRLGSRASVVAHCPALLFARQERRRACCSSLPKVDKQLSCLAKIRGGSSPGDEWTNGYP